MTSKPVIKIHPLPSGQEEHTQEIGQLSVDIYHTEKEIVIIAPAAGVTPEEMHLSITNDVLVIKGERRLAQSNESKNYYTRECFWGPFSRSIVLPLEAKVDQISAEWDKNILTIRIPKGEKDSTKIIKISNK